jgi:hypothetical protein
MSKVDRDIDHTLLDNRGTLSRERLNKIGPCCFSYYNGVNICCAPVGSGKTISTLREIIKIVQVSEQTHLLVYISQDGSAYDDSFEILKNKITPYCYIQYVVESKAVEFMKDLYKWKDLYMRIKDQHAEDDVVDEEEEILFEKLHIDNYDQPFLHTIVLLEDITKVHYLIMDRFHFLNG